MHDAVAGSGAPRWQRYGGSATHWGLAIHTSSNDRYEAAPWFTGTPQDALNLVCDLYVTCIDT
ncbi:hypothetical protein [Nonomuraea sp. NPDC049400]|uniref:hypothetical protein n=1 Tax=Nonomuraea sp. NPDC049400 TaxID=3364352 RepID=UPI0037976D1C